MKNASKSGTPKSTRAKVKSIRRANMTATAAAAEGAETFSKSAFIRTFKLDVPAKEIVEAAAKLGKVITENYVYAIRSADKTKAEAKAESKSKAEKKAPAKKTAAAKGAKKAAKKVADEDFNKSEFIRSFESDVPAKEIVEAAAKKGHKIAETYIYAIRSADKSKAATKGKTSAARGRRAAAPPSAPASTPEVAAAAPPSVSDAAKAMPGKLLTQLIEGFGVKGARDILASAVSRVDQLTA